MGCGLVFRKGDSKMQRAGVGKKERVRASEGGDGYMGVLWAASCLVAKGNYEKKRAGVVDSIIRFGKII